MNGGAPVTADERTALQIQETHTSVEVIKNTLELWPEIYPTKTDLSTAIKCHEDEKHKKIQELSKGYKQRVGLAQAMIHDPDILSPQEATTQPRPYNLQPTSHQEY